MRATRREGIVSARNLKRRVLKGAWRRTGNLLIVSSFVTKRATVFKYSVNGIYRGERNFSTETGAASNLRKLSRNKFCIHPRDTFHSRRLPRTRGGGGGEHLFRVSLRYRSMARGKQHLPKLRFIDRKLIVCVFLCARVHPLSLGRKIFKKSDEWIILTKRYSIIIRLKPEWIRLIIKFSQSWAKNWKDLFELQIID